jgi:hypothetical protein
MTSAIKLFIAFYVFRMYRSIPQAGVDLLITLRLPKERGFAKWILSQVIKANMIQLNK